MYASSDLFLRRPLLVVSKDTRIAWRHNLAVLLKKFLNYIILVNIDINSCPNPNMKGIYWNIWYLNLRKYLLYFNYLNILLFKLVFPNVILFNAIQFLLNFVNAFM